MKKFLIALLMVAGATPLMHAQTQILADTSLEVIGGSSGTDWSSTSTNFGSVLCSVGLCGNCGGPCVPHTGDYYAWFGGTTSLETGTLTQSFNVPAAGNGTLRFWLMMPGPGNASDSIAAKLDGNLLWFRTGLDTAGFSSYARVDVNIPSISSGTHTLELIGKQSGTSGGTFNALVDDITLYVDGTVGFSEYDFSNGFTMYADHNDHTLNLAFSYSTASNPTVMVTDMAGRVLENRTLSEVTTFAYTIGTSTWAEGIYNVTIMEAGGSFTKKVHIRN